MSERKIKINLNEKKKNLSFKAIEKLKQQIEKIDANKIIIEALSSSNRKHPDKNPKKNEVLEQTKTNIINSFYNDIKNKEKKIKLIRSASEKKYQNFLDAIKLLEERAKKEAKEYISKYELLSKEKKMLNQRLINLNSQYNDIYIQQKNFINQIKKMEKRDSILEANRPILNDFFKYIKNKEPKKVIEDIENQDFGYKSISKEYNKTINKIIFDRKLFEIKYSNNQKRITALNNKILNIKEENNVMQKDYESAINDLKNEILNLQGLKEDNDKYRKMLYQLYNRLIGSYCLDKNIRKNNKCLKLVREDYKPNLLDDNEISKYIKLMISAMNPNTSAQLLRETIAYSNMITRVYLKKKINLKYDPLSTFKELKEIMEKNEEKILELSNNVKEYEEKINKMGIENKRLNNIINFYHLEKNKSIENKQNMNTPNHRNKKKGNESSSTPYSTSRNKKINFTKMKPKITETRIKSSHSTLTQRSKMRRNNLITRTRITDDNRRRQSSDMFNKKINLTKNRLTMTGIFDEDDIYQYHSIDSKDLKKPIFQSLQSMNNSPLINKHHKNEIYQFLSGIKQLKKRKDDSQSMATYINEFQKLINHMNRLFLYKAKNSYTIDRSKKLKYSRNKKINGFNNLIKSIRKNQSTGNFLPNFVKKKIVGKLNGIINNLSYKENDDNKNE